MFFLKIELFPERDAQLLVQEIGQYVKKNVI